MNVTECSNGKTKASKIMKPASEYFCDSTIWTISCFILKERVEEGCSCIQQKKIPEENWLSVLGHFVGLAFKELSELINFYPLWNHQNIYGFLMMSSKGIEVN